MNNNALSCDCNCHNCHCRPTVIMAKHKTSLWVAASQTCCGLCPINGEFFNVFCTFVPRISLS